MIQILLRILFNTIKNIIAIFYLSLLKILFERNPPENCRNLLFINTEQLGDLVISSILLEYDQIFNRFDNVYFICQDKYSDLFKNYNGTIKIIYLNKDSFKKSIKYNILFIKKIVKLQISEVYNIGQSRGQISEILVHTNQFARKFVLNNEYRYLGKRFLKIWNKKYDHILFDEIGNEYLKMENLLKKFNPSFNYLTRSDVFATIHHSESNIKINPYIIIAPYSLNKNKEWEAKHYKQIIKAINNKLKILILCSAEQKNRALHDFNNIENVIISCVDLSEVPIVINNCMLFIGIDSGLTHFAAKLDSNIFAIIGGGTYGRYFPIPGKHTVKYYFKELDCFGCEWDCIHENIKCLKGIEKTILLELLKLI